MPMWNVARDQDDNVSRTSAILETAVGFATAQRTTASSDKLVGSCLSPLRTASLPIFVRAVTNPSRGAY
jgi:hypothetical protein